MQNQVETRSSVETIIIRRETPTRTIFRVAGLILSPLKSLGGIRRKKKKRFCDDGINISTTEYWSVLCPPTQIFLENEVEVRESTAV
jgi:hypothetical protein